MVRTAYMVGKPTLHMLPRTLFQIFYQLRYIVNQNLNLGPEIEMSTEIKRNWSNQNISLDLDHHTVSEIMVRPPEFGWKFFGRERPSLFYAKSATRTFRETLNRAGPVANCMHSDTWIHVSHLIEAKRTTKMLLRLAQTDCECEATEIRIVIKSTR